VGIQMQLAFLGQGGLDHLAEPQVEPLGQILGRERSGQLLEACLEVSWQTGRRLVMLHKT
jgi:hypothetical protein